MIVYVLIGFIWASVILDIYTLSKTVNRGTLFISDDDEIYMKIDIPVEEIRKKKYIRLSIRKIKSVNDSQQ